MAILRSPRLLLEPLGPDDLPALHAHWTEPAVRRFLWDGQVVSRDQVEAAIETSQELFREYGAGLWAVRLEGTEDLIGCGGFWYFHDPPELELLLSLSSACWHRGLAQETARALLAYVFDGLGWPVVQASADAPNTASLRLMHRLGMKRAGERPGAFGTIEVYQMTATAWSRSPGPA
jgi:[ribosomal protein S5]-alanine N-acetyltransferase